MEEKNEENIVNEKIDENVITNEVEQKNNNIKVNVKKKINLQVIITILLVIAIITATMLVIFFKIEEINSKYIIEDTDNELIVDNIEEQKSEDPDKIYLAASGTDTYNYNGLTYNYMYDIDGNTYVQGENEVPNTYNKSKVNYIQINGLRDENIQNKINADIKEKALSFLNLINAEKAFIRCNLVGNFSNILSISFDLYIDKLNSVELTQFKTLNYNLNNGEKIKFEDLFIKSTPINSIIADATYDALAWNIQGDFATQEYLNNSNMDNRDTSDYEDILLKAVNFYNTNKENLDFTISPTSISIYNIKIDELKYENASYYRILSINTFDYMDYIAIYKRYVKEGITLYNTSNNNNIITYTTPIGSNDRRYIYGKISDNLYIDISDVNIDDEKVKSLATKLINEYINDIKNTAKNDKQNGYVYQAMMSYWKQEKTQYYSATGKYSIPYICISLMGAKAKMNTSDFANLSYYLRYIDTLPIASIDGKMLGGSYQIKKQFPNIEQNYENKTWYFDLNGNYLGDDVEVIYQTKQQDLAS